MTSIEAFVHAIPKAELHIHIEGSLQPELMFQLAERNGLSLPYSSVEEVRAAYRFTDLQSFLDIYYAGASVLIAEQDFYDMTWAYLVKAHEQNVRHTEIFFDPQTHTDRGVSFAAVISGIHSALHDAQNQFGMSSHLIMCFLRHLSAAAAMDTLEQALPYKHWIIAVGLDSSEIGHPPEKFRHVFERALAEGLLTVAHAGEEGPPAYIWQALDLLRVSRIDHGVQCTKDAKLVERLAAQQVPLTVCPLSNVALRVFGSLEQHNLKQLLDLGLCATVNSDDPAYFGGYVNENLIAVCRALHLGQDDVYRLVKNSFRASFLPEKQKSRLIEELDAYAARP